MKIKKAVKFVSIFILSIIFMYAWTWIPVTERISLDLTDNGPIGFRIALITDLHSCYYGKGQKSLIDRIDNEEPDIVVFSGDIFDDKLSDENAKIVFEDLVTKYPCYYVTGNHEYWSGRADSMKDYLRSIGVHVLEGDCKRIEVEDHTIDMCGVDDPTDIGYSPWIDQFDRAYSETDPSHIRILVSHRPEKINTYEKYDFDLILAGHAHAGQFRIPFINRGLFVPDQGSMALYVSGQYELPNGSIMVVSRGLARESTPLPRFFNHPEVVIIDI